MRVLFALTFFVSCLYVCNALTIPNFFNWFLDFDDHNEIDDSSQKWDPYGSYDGTQRQSRGGYQSLDTQELSGYQHSEAHHYAEDAPSDVTDHILPVFLIAFCASIVNSLFLFKSAVKKDCGCSDLNTVAATSSTRRSTYVPSNQVQDFWSLVNQPECSSCDNNGVMVDHGWTTEVNFYSNLTCCDGKLYEVLTSPPDIGSDCIIQNMTYMIDTSGSMGFSKPYWLPISLQLVDFFNDAGVMMGDYTLIDYVPTASISLTTPEKSDFQTAISDINDFSGFYEATFEGLKFSLEQSSCHNYIMVFTDEIGNDVNNATLKNEIITLRDEKKSCIFFVVIDYGDGFFQWEETFGDVGNVIQIDIEFDYYDYYYGGGAPPAPSQEQLDEAMKKILDSTKDCSVCQETCSASSSSSSGSREPSEKEWTTILRRKGYGNPADYFIRSPKEYRKGFGEENREFFIGLENLVNMTSSGSWMLEVTLVDNEDREEMEYTATYDTFKVFGDKYELIIGGYDTSSNLADKLVNGTQWDFKGSCATSYGGGWWFPYSGAKKGQQRNKKIRNLRNLNSLCGDTTLTGPYHPTKEMMGVLWDYDGGHPSSWPYAEMKIKQVSSPRKR